MKDQNTAAATSNDQPHHTTTPVPPVPPPTPQQSSRNNATSLLSPWWSVEQQQQQQQEEKEQREPQSDKARHFLIHFTRIVNGTAQESSAPLFVEQCVLLTRHDRSDRNSNNNSSNNTTPAISDLPHHNQQAPGNCRMVCLLRENEERRKAYKQAKPSLMGNPFHGLWVVVAKTQARCLEHTAEKDIIKKNHSDYYTINLGERFSGSGDDVKRAVARTFAPMQELTRRYIKSWQDGTQSAFLSRFWESAMRGDGLILLKDSTKKLFKVAESGDDNSNSNGGGGNSSSSSSSSAGRRTTTADNNKKNSEKDNSSNRGS